MERKISQGGVDSTGYSAGGRATFAKRRRSSMFTLYFWQRCVERLKSRRSRLLDRYRNMGEGLKCGGPATSLIVQEVMAEEWTALQSEDRRLPSLWGPGGITEVRGPCAMLVPSNKSRLAPNCTTVLNRDVFLNRCATLWRIMTNWRFWRKSSRSSCLMVMRCTLAAKSANRHVPKISFRTDHGRKVTGRKFSHST